MNVCEHSASSEWVELVPAAARLELSVREVLALVDAGRLAASVERGDRTLMMFRAEDLAGFNGGN